MENSGAVTIEGENYEVVDECVEDEDASKPVENLDVCEKQPANEPSNDEASNNNAKEDENTLNVDPTNEAPVDNTASPSNAEDVPPDVAPDVASVVALDVAPDIAAVVAPDVASVVEPVVASVVEPVVELDLAPDVAPDVVLDAAPNAAPKAEDTDTKTKKTDPIDFTADVSLDQLDEQKDVTDEDVHHQLDEIENMELDSSDFQEQKKTNETVEENKTVVEKDNSEQKNESNENSTGEQTVSYLNNKQDPENSEKYDWYEKKLAEKQAIIKERLSKVARVLGISYPCYEKWLEWEEKVRGNTLCRLKPARRCRLDKPYTNRWKFICKRVSEIEISMDEAGTSGTKATETIWKLEVTGACGININNESEFPPFVLRAVKIFEEFLQTTEQQSTPENFSDDISIDVETRKEPTEVKQEWLWLLVRCNSMDELMLFATGRNISRATMERLKQVYESGPGKDCNVKSLYCKSMNKLDDTVVTNTTFLVGSEALDEVVGGLKVQLAPKTNFWSNTAGVENVAHAVRDLLAPNSKTVVLEIGCGIGLIGLMMASKCQQVIGVDSPSEVEEAEMTCELNNIKNATFIMGSPSEVTGKIVAAVKNRKTSAIINANTNIGRALEVVMCLRKILSLRRIVMITTLTKQSVRAILELARPGDHNHGLPFIPTFAIVVDTLPVGPHFEAVILLQRRSLNKLDQTMNPRNPERMKGKPAEVKSTPEKVGEPSVNEPEKKSPIKGPELWTKKNFNKTTPKQFPKKGKILLKKQTFPKNSDTLILKNKFKAKRSHSPDKGEVPPKKIMKKFGKFGDKTWQTDQMTKKKKEWGPENTQLRINPLYEKKLREHKEQADLRERLSNNRLDTDIAQTVKEHQTLLEIAKEKLSGSAPTVDVSTAKQLQNMLNMVLEQTNKLQSQLPRSVWDRIAPPENVNLEQREMKQEEHPLKGRYVQETGSQDILITTPNKSFVENEEPKPFYKKYNNIPPLEPNLVMSVSFPLKQRDEQFHPTQERYREMDARHPAQNNSWNRDKPFERNRWNEMGGMRRQASPTRHRMSPPQSLSPKRPLLSPPRRPCSPPRRHFSPLHRPTSPMYRQRSPMRRQMSPPRRLASPPRRMSPNRRPPSPRRMMSPPRRNEAPMNRPTSPMRRQMSPQRRQVTMMRPTMSPPRRQMSPMRRQMSPPRRQIPSPNRMAASNKLEILLKRRKGMMQQRQEISPVRRGMPQEGQQMSPGRRGGSPQRFMFGRPASPPRRPQSPPRRQMSPPQRFGDEWDIPSRRAVEQNTWSRPSDRMSDQNVWQSDKPSTSSNSWDQSSCNDRQRKNMNQEKWNNKDSVRNEMWNSGANDWSPKQSSPKPLMTKEAWSSGSDNRWSNASNVPGNSNNDNWNIRGKDNFSARNESWMDNKKQGRWEAMNVKESWKQSDKDDVIELPEDARDPWGDEGGNLGNLKERWMKFEINNPSSSTWTRENEQGDSWSKPKDNWQNKGMLFNAKPQWQNNGLQKAGESRWIGQNTVDKKQVSNTWQSGKNMGSWQPQSSSFQSQRPFSTNQFKGFN